MHPDERREEGADLSGDRDSAGEHDAAGRHAQDLHMRRDVDEREACRNKRRAPAGEDRQAERRYCDRLRIRQIGAAAGFSDSRQQTMHHHLLAASKIHGGVRGGILTDDRV